MEKIVLAVLLSGALFMTNGCVAVQQASFSTSPEAADPGVHRLSVRASSRKVLAETVESAHAQCRLEDKRYLFVKNIFRSGTYTLYFTCVEEGDSRLKERKLRRMAPEEKATPEKAPEVERTVPEKAKLPAPVQPTPVPAKPPLTEQPPPVPEKPTLPEKEIKAPQEEAPLSEEELLRELKKNPGPGELEKLRPEDTLLDIEDELNSIIIEESLEGEVPLDLERYLKNRRKKKKSK